MASGFRLLTIKIDFLLKHFYLFKLLSVLFLLLQMPSLYAQVNDTVVADDSMPASFMQKVADAGNKDRMRSKDNYAEGRISLKQNKIVTSLLHAAQSAKIFLDTDLDLIRLESELDRLNNSFNLVQDGILVNPGTAQTDRNLTVSAIILDQLIDKAQESKRQLDRYAERLIGYRNTFDSLLSDPAMYSFPKDSAKAVLYLNRLRVMATEGNPTDNALNHSLEQAQRLQNKVDSTLFSFRVAEEKIGQYRTDLSSINLKREFHNIWDKVGYTRNFADILRFSMAKEQIALAFYAQDHALRIFILCVLVGLVWYSIRALRKHLSEHDRTKELVRLLAMQKPLASACLIVLSIYQFAFINAPFIFSFCIWLVQCIALLVILYRFIIPFWFRFWLGIIILFLLACLGNFTLQASRPERWIMLILSLTGVLFCSYFLLARKEKKQLKEQTILIYLRFLLVFELASVILNSLGRYNLSKTLFTAGYTGTVTAIIFIWTIRLINECLEAASELYHHPERKLLYLNFNRVGRKVPRLWYVLLTVGWFIIVGRNFYFYNKFSIHFLDFLHKPRTIGDYTFALDGLFLFLLIAVGALFLSRLVSLFSADPNAEHSSMQQQSGSTPNGSWILLLRIAIITLGLFVAFAASGLPIDKITIVLGALSVGVGLGLQSLVGNLVSGLIIAFERPVNVGDQIEINNKSGIMKSIGFRSSVVLLNDGSCLIVPNGDLLSTHLINWSISNNRRKLTITVNVDYGSDLQQVIVLLKDIASEDERILQHPEVQAVARELGAQAIVFDLVFWIRNQFEAISISSMVITRIHTVFKEKGIVIPHPQKISLQLSDKTSAKSDDES